MKHALSSLLSGASIGILIELLTAILLSSVLHLGYVMLCPAWLPKCVGGEIPAAFLQTALFALAGIIIKQTLNSRRTD